MSFHAWDFIFFKPTPFNVLTVVYVHTAATALRMSLHTANVSLSGKKNTDRYLSPLHLVGSALVSLRVMVGIRFTSILHSSQPALPLRMQFSHFFFRIYSTEIRKWLDEKKKRVKGQRKKNKKHSAG